MKEKNQGIFKALKILMTLILFVSLVFYSNGIGKPTVAELEFPNFLMEQVARDIIELERFSGYVISNFDDLSIELSGSAFDEKGTKIIFSKQRELQSRNS